jgi:hypothetical protein
MKLIDESVGGGAQSAAAQAVIAIGAMSHDDSGTIGSNESSPRKSQGSPHQSSQRSSPRGSTSPHLPSFVSAESPRNTSRGMPRATKKSGQL